MIWLNRIGMLFEFLSFWLIAPETITALLRDEGQWLDNLRQRLVVALSNLRVVLLLSSTGIAILLVGVILFSLFSPSTANTILEPPVFGTILGLFVTTNTLLAFASREQLQIWLIFTRRRLGRWNRNLMVSIIAAMVLAWLSFQSGEFLWILLAVAGIAVASLAQRLINKMVFRQLVSSRERVAVVASFVGWYAGYMWLTLSYTGPLQWLITLGQLTLTAYLIFVLLQASLPTALRGLANSETLRRQLFITGVVLFVSSFLLQIIATFGSE